MSGRPRAAHTLGQTQGTVTHPQLGNMWLAGLLNRCFIWNCGLIAVVGGRFILQLMFYLVDSIVKLINVLLRSFSICEGGGTPYLYRIHRHPTHLSASVEMAVF